MIVKKLIKRLSIKYPPGPSFSELLKISEKSEAYATLDYPSSLTERFGELIYFKAAKQYLITGPLGFEHILKTKPANYSKQNIFYNRMRPLFGNSLLLTEGQRWKHHRKITQPAFQLSSLKNYIPTLIEECQRFTENLKANPPTKINLLSSMNQLTLSIALRLFCSKSFSEKELKLLGKSIHFGNWYVSHTFMVKPWKPTFRNLQFYYFIHRLNRFLLSIIEARRKDPNPPQDLLDLLIKAKNEAGTDGLTDNEILDEFKTLLLTGHETTACGLTWMWALLAENPQYLALLEQELANTLGGRSPAWDDLEQLPILKAILSETFRLYPPIWTLVRKNIEEDIICGYTIPADSLLALNIYALHRNPFYWENPTVFYPDRFFDNAEKQHPYAYLPFSTGPRICIASHFGMMESLITAAILAQQIRFEKIRKSPVIAEPCISLRPKGGLWMRPKPR